MQAFRNFVRVHRTLAAWLLACALLLKIAVPGGYMLDGAGGSFGLVICSGMAPTPPIAMPGMAHHAAAHQGHKDDQKAEQPCAFAGLAAPSLAGADPFLLAVAIAFIVAGVFRRGSQQPFAAPPYQRPPLRAPPAHA